jgi:hypothetical protein
MKSALILFTLCYSFQLYSMFIPTTDDSSNNRDYRASICSMEPLYSADQKLIRYNVKKDDSVFYYSQSAENAVKMLAGTKGHALCQIKSEACFLVKDATGREAVLMSNTALIIPEKNKAQALLIKMQQTKVCTKNGVIVGDYNSESRKLENKSVRYSEEESRKFFK